MMQDQYGRTIDYVRLAVTDRCNLRCNYCLPEGFTDFLPKDHLLTYEELLRLARILSSLGVRKMRITGGEPFVRRDLMSFLGAIAEERLFEDLRITTNGVLTAPHVERLQELGFTSVNLSLDTLNKENFKKITGRDRFDDVMKTLDLLEESSMKVRINAVVLPDQNIDDLPDLVRYAEVHKTDIAFIEEMPFNGKGEPKPLIWDHKKMSDWLTRDFGAQALPMKPSATAQWFDIDGFQGRIGVIAAYSRTFCGSCNRLRIGPKGGLQTCLYGLQKGSVFSLFRSGADDHTIADYIRQVVRGKEKDGFEAERNMLEEDGHHHSMATIGG